MTKKSTEATHTVVRNFNDKHTRERRTAGQEVTYTGDRAKELEGRYIKRITSADKEKSE